MDFLSNDWQREDSSVLFKARRYRFGGESPASCRSVTHFVHLHLHKTLDEEVLAVLTVEDVRQQRPTPWETEPEWRGIEEKGIEEKFRQNCDLRLQLEVLTDEQIRAAVDSEQTADLLIECRDDLKGWKTWRDLIEFIEQRAAYPITEGVSFGMWTDVTLDDVLFLPGVSAIATYVVEGGSEGWWLHVQAIKEKVWSSDGGLQTAAGTYNACGPLTVTVKTLGSVEVLLNLMVEINRWVLGLPEGAKVWNLETRAGLPNREIPVAAELEDGTHTLAIYDRVCERWYAVSGVRTIPPLSQVKQWAYLPGDDA